MLTSSRQLSVKLAYSQATDRLAGHKDPHTHTTDGIKKKRGKRIKKERGSRTHLSSLLIWTANTIALCIWVSHGTDEWQVAQSLISDRRVSYFSYLGSICEQWLSSDKTFFSGLYIHIYNLFWLFVLHLNYYYWLHLISMCGDEW